VKLDEYMFQHLRAPGEALIIIRWSRWLGQSGVSQSLHLDWFRFWFHFCNCVCHKTCYKD